MEARRINAGYEWFGMMVGDSDHPSMDPGGFDYVVSFSGPTPGFREVGTAPWRSAWPPRDRVLHVLENRAPPPRRAGPPRAPGPQGGGGGGTGRPREPEA